MSIFKKRPSPAMIVAIIAVILATAPFAGAAATAVTSTVFAQKASHATYASKAGFATTAKYAISAGAARHATTAETAGAADKATSAFSAGFATNAADSKHAVNADNAINAANAANAARAGSSASTDNIRTWFATASIGQTVTLMTIGPFTYTGVCTAGPHAQTFVATSQDNSAADSYADQSGYTSDMKDPWGPGDGTLSVGYSSSEHSSDGTPQWVGPYDGSDTQISGDGHTFVNTFASVGTMFGGSDCTFTGHAAVRTQ